MPILPKKLEIHGYFSFRQPQVIDFEPLWRSGGLWGILGPNGAGKSSILEAILLALYHKSPRAKSEETIRTRGFSERPYIRLFFEYEGNNYLSVYPTDKPNRLLRALPGYELLKPNEVEKMLRISYEDFILTIVLPQGQFAKLLESTISQQSQILSNFLPDRPWNIITEKIKAVKEFLEGEKNNLEGQIKTYQASLAKLSEITPEKLAEIEKQIQSLEADRTAQEKRLQELRTQLTLAETRDKLLNEFQALSQQLTDLRSQKEILDQILHPNVTTLLHELNYHLRMLVEEKKKITEKTQNIDQITAELRNLQKKHTELNNRYEQRRPLHENQSELLTLHSLARQRETARNNRDNLLGDLAKHLRKLRNPVPFLPQDNPEAWKDLLEKQLSSGKDIWVEIEKLAEQIDKTLSEAENLLRKLQVDQALHAYVAQLQEGQPCPVCGSTHHPAKRPIPENLSQQLQEAKNRLKALQEDRNVLASIQPLKKLITDAFREYNRINMEFANLGKVLTQKMNRELVYDFLKAPDPTSLIREADGLRRQLDDLHTKISRTEGFLDNLVKEREILDKSVSSLETKQKEIEAQLAELLPPHAPPYQAFWQMLRRDGPTKTEEWAQKTLSDINKKLERYQELQKTLQDEKSPYKDLPHTPDISREVQELAAKLSNIQATINALNIQKGKLQNELTRKDELSKQLAEAEEKLEAISSELRLIQKAQQETVGSELEKFFVRQVLLRPLIKEVNGYLRDWLGGRIELLMPEETAGNTDKDALLQVWDALLSPSSKPRSVRTLSGGEKFLVSLALALTLSDQIMQLKKGQKGIRQGFFFIDEGFDTLSTENFALVMRTLQRLAVQGRRIGLVSHKMEAREYLSAYLEVHKENHTTKVTLRTAGS